MSKFDNLMKNARKGNDGVKEIWNEYWKPVLGFEGYEVSSIGRVRSVDRVVIDKRGRQIKRKGKMLKQHLEDGYSHVMLCKHSKHKHCAVHRLVAMAFIENDDVTKTAVHHIDNNHLNNNADNLIWLTPKEHDTMHAKERCKQVACRELPIIFDSRTEATLFLGVSQSNIYNNIKGIYKSAGKIKGPNGNIKLHWYEENEGGKHNGLY